LVVAALLAAAVAWAAMGLEKKVTIVYDENEVPTIRAKRELDAIYTLGYLHARDRFFQMDLQRRAFSGTLATLLGPGPGNSVLGQDIQLRTLGLRRAAERSMAVQTPEMVLWLEAYSDGVNDFLGDAVFGTDDDELCDESNDDYSDDPRARAERLFHQLPLEYSALEIDRNGIPPWTPLDSLTVAKGLAFQLSFDLEDIDRTLALLTFLGTGEVFGFNGLQLFSADLYPVAPFDPTTTVNSFGPLWQEPEQPAPLTSNEPGQLEDFMASGPTSQPGPPEEPFPQYMESPNLPGLLQAYRDEIAQYPLLRRAVEQDYTQQGSNWFVSSGANTVSGFPMIANDPHLDLTTPATFYEAHIQYKHGSDVINVAGSTFPGAPGVVLGCNDVICWGAAVNPLDVVDVYQEILLALGPNPLQPTHIFRADGPPEALEFIPQTFMVNIIGNNIPNTIVDAGIPPESGGVTIIVPRRNNGPIVQVQVDPGPPLSFVGISVQYTGWSATQELETFRRFAIAESVEDFREALQFFDFGSQNWGYADINGNIAFFTSGELPIREDLQNFPFVPAGLQPPFLIRDGTHTLRHDWQPKLNPQPQQALDTEILPFDEMPQQVNPDDGLILCANNDPIGTSLDGVPWNEFRAGFNGRLYLSPGYAPGFRAGRIQQLFDDALAGGPLTPEQFDEFMGNNQLLDAEVFVPFLLDAFANASVSATPPLAALAADADIAEAIGRLAAWDFSTPTGIPEGYDAGDVLPLLPPTQQEIDASVAATIYSVWRGQVVQRIIDQTLAGFGLAGFAPGSSQSLVAVRKLLEGYPVSGGVGQSLIDFIEEPDGGGDLFDDRDLILLRALKNALNLLASDEFAPAFANSTVQDDYRWGKLHRIVFAHPLGGPFNVPPTGGPGNVGPLLPGFARSGGLGAVDASSHSARSDGLNEFMFDAGPARRFLATMAPTGPDAHEVIPGGEVGALGSPHRADQLLNLWLVNDFHPLPLTKQDVFANSDSCQFLVPTVPTTGSMPEDTNEPEEATNDSILQEFDFIRDSPRSDGRTIKRETIRPPR
jgi:penicillin amidase